MSGRHFVFLQGMPCDFFSRIAHELNTAGCQTTGINFCVGDSLFWRGQTTIDYRGTLTDWPQTFRELVISRGFSDLVLLGEQRSYHRPAVDIALALGLNVTVTDFGYLRPDWITLERNGMSGASLFPRDPSEIRRMAAAVGEIDFARRFHDDDNNMMVGDVRYNFANLFFGWKFPHYRRSDKRPPTLKYTLSITRRLLGTLFTARRMQARMAALLATRPRYFLFPLQLDHDFQIVAYSPYPSLKEACDEVLRSFARYAPADTRLVIKVHPWDPGLCDWAQWVTGLATSLGLGRRVEVLDGGYLDTLITHSLGMVTVNSTSGLRALQLHSPVIVLGQAIYDVPGLTFAGTLDRYWTEASAPDAELKDAFFRALAGSVQIRGVFFNEPGKTAAVSAAVRRLLDRTVGVPLPDARSLSEATRNERIDPVEMSGPSR